MHEYLATGRPVISTPLDTVRPFSHIIALATQPSEWETAIIDALENGGVGRPQDRIAVAEANSWDARVDELDALLQRCIERGE